MVCSRPFHRIPSARQVPWVGSHVKQEPPCSLAARGSRTCRDGEARTLSLEGCAGSVPSRHETLRPHSAAAVPKSLVVGRHAHVKKEALMPKLHRLRGLAKIHFHLQQLCVCSSAPLRAGVCRGWDGGGLGAETPSAERALYRREHGHRCFAVARRRMAALRRRHVVVAVGRGRRWLLISGHELGQPWRERNVRQRMAKLLSSACARTGCPAVPRARLTEN